MVALQTIVNILGPESPASYGVVLPILSIATDINQPDELNLLEDGLALWLVTLRNAPEPHPSVLQIFPNLHAVMARSTEHIRVWPPSLRLPIYASLLSSSFLTLPAPE